MAQVFLCVGNITNLAFSDSYEIKFNQVLSNFLNINIRGSSATFMAFRIFGNAIANNSFANLICLLIYEVAKFKARSNPFCTFSSSTLLGTKDSMISDNVWNRIPSTIVPKISNFAYY